MLSFLFSVWSTQVSSLGFSLNLWPFPCIGSQPLPLSQSDRGADGEWPRRRPTVRIYTTLSVSIWGLCGLISSSSPTHTHVSWLIRPGSTSIPPTARGLHSWGTHPSHPRLHPPFGTCKIQLMWVLDAASNRSTGPIESPVGDGKVGTQAFNFLISIDDEWSSCAQLEYTVSQCACHIVLVVGSSLLEAWLQSINWLLALFCVQCGPDPNAAS